MAYFTKLDDFLLNGLVIAKFKFWKSVNVNGLEKGNEKV